MCPHFHCFILDYLEYILSLQVIAFSGHSPNDYIRFLRLFPVDLYGFSWNIIIERECAENSTSYHINL